MFRGGKTVALFGYFKGEPGEYILSYSGGKLSREGQGITFFYWGPSTSVISVPIGTIDVPFILNETTGNFQVVTVQGQLTYRISNPKAVASILNFTIDPSSRKYLSDDPEKLAQRIVNEVQSLTRFELQKLPLEETLKESMEIATRILCGIKDSKALIGMGVEVTSLHLIAIKPTPEMGKALEAEYRESLQTKADQAIYNRRATGVEQERRIKENELATLITIEEKRKNLVDLQGKNNCEEAEFAAKATAIKLAPYKEISPQVLLALSLREMGANAGKIGNLTITSEILSTLLKN